MNQEYIKFQTSEGTPVQIQNYETIEERIMKNPEGFTKGNRSEIGNIGDWNISLGSGSKYYELQLKQILGQYENSESASILQADTITKERIDIGDYVSFIIRKFRTGKTEFDLWYSIKGEQDGGYGISYGIIVEEIAKIAYGLKLPSEQEIGEVLSRIKKIGKLHALPQILLEQVAESHPNLSE